MAAPGGTAAALAGWRSGAREGVTLHLAKTGTARDAFLAGGLVYRGIPCSYLALADGGARRGGWVGGDLAPLVREALATLEPQ